MRVVIVKRVFGDALRPIHTRLSSAYSIVRQGIAQLFHLLCARAFGSQFFDLGKNLIANLCYFFPRFWQRKDVPGGRAATFVNATLNRDNRFIAFNKLLVEAGTVAFKQKVSSEGKRVILGRASRGNLPAENESRR